MMKTKTNKKERLDIDVWRKIADVLDECCPTISSMIISNIYDEKFSGLTLSSMKDKFSVWAPGLSTTVYMEDIHDSR